MSLHALANAPDFADVGVAQRPVAFERIAQIHYAAGDIEQPFGCVVGELGQCLRARDPHPDWNACALEKGGAHVPAKRGQISRHASQIGKRFIDVKERCQPMDIGLNEYLSGSRSGVRCP